jgi:hypothetical protein
MKRIICMKIATNFIILACSLAVQLEPAFAQLDDKATTQPNEEKRVNGINNDSDVAPIHVKVKPSFNFDLTTPAPSNCGNSCPVKGADHVANGVALRNRASGTIHLRGVPNINPATGLPTKVISALLYWNYSDGISPGTLTSRALFSGNLITGDKVADNPEPCWDNLEVKNHTYRADVTSFVSTLSHPNQDYQVVIGLGGISSTTGQNPWNPWEDQAKRLNGATLIVVYEGTGQVSIYDQLSGTTLLGSEGTFNLLNFFPNNPSGLFTVTGADGQRVGVVGDTETWFNDNLLLDNWGSASGYPANDWNGNTGAPFPQLWDVHTHLVSFENPTGTSPDTVVHFKVANDCVVPVAFVLDD